MRGRGKKKSHNKKGFSVQAIRAEKKKKKFDKNAIEEILIKNKCLSFYAFLGRFFLSFIKETYSVFINICRV